MDPIASELNEQIKKNSPSVFDVLSSLGKELYFPKGILTQSEEAGEMAHKYNATSGIAVENSVPMHLNVVDQYFNRLTPNEIYPYAKPAGRPKLRALWKKKLEKDNPSLQGKSFGEPIVTSALTHGLSIVADLFTDEGDVVVSPDKLWGNYRLIFSTRRRGKIETFPLFNDANEFNTDAFAQVLAEQAKKKDKLIVMLNFPNNPTGYTPTVAEAEKIYTILKVQAEKGTKIVAVSDDAYFGLFFEDTIKESLFSGLCNLHENILATKIDGSTKEQYVWGFRTGFLTFGTKCQNGQELYWALENKVKGIIRGTISSCAHSSQSIVEKILEDGRLEENLKDKYEVLKARATHLKAILSTDKYDDSWEFYPFNSGYLMCLKLKQVDAEDLRVHLLKRYGVGTISVGVRDLRIAYSCIEVEQLEEVVNIIYQGVQDLAK